MADQRFRSYAEFWPFYLREHAQPAARLLHYVGSALALAALAGFLLTGKGGWLLAAPIAGYGFAWTAHATVEHNRPATFTHPLWSLISDYRMLLLFVTGRLGPELERAGVRPRG